MKKANFVLILFTVILQSCNNDCGECFTPPLNFMFEIVDKTNGENLFTNGTYEPDQIQITNTLNNSPSEFSFLSENDINLIVLEGFGFETEILSLTISISGNHIFDLYVDAERKTEDCCSFTKYNEITIEGPEFERDSQTGIYKIFVE